VGSGGFGTSNKMSTLEVSNTEKATVEVMLILVLLVFPCRYVEQGKESSRSAYILWQSSGLSQGGFQLLMVGFVACILFLGFTYFRMLRTSRLRPAMIRTGSLANIVRSASFIGRI
jgi:hypothetical protein